MDGVDRRTMLALLCGAAGLPLLGSAAMAAAPGFLMWRDPGCGCCTEWAKRMEAAFGRKMAVVNRPDMAAIKRARGVPAALQSCHTAAVHGYTIEGHVPPADIKRLIASGNRRVRGLAVPGMPAGSPGMDVGHSHREAFKVYAFGTGAPQVFASHGAGLK